MTEATPDPPGPSAWSDACLAARILAADPAGLGGIRLRARSGPVRERWLALLRAAVPADRPFVRVPLGTGDERLLGGLDLAATLASGRPVAEPGLLAAADGGILLLPSAERCSPGTAARIAAALDTGEVAAERDGFALRHAARFALVLLDEGAEPDERPPEALADRCALHLDLTEVAWGETNGSADARPSPPKSGLPDLGPPRFGPRQQPGSVRGGVGGAGAEPDDRDSSPGHPPLRFARDLPPLKGEGQGVGRSLEPVLPLRRAVPDAIVDALCGAAFAFGLGSLRAPLQAVAVAEAAAVLAGRATVEAEDAALAARLVLAPRATRRPADPDSAPAEAPPDIPPDGASQGQDRPEDGQTPDPSLDDVVRDAVAAAIPAGLLLDLKDGAPARGRSAASPGAGAERRDRRRGRPAGTLPGDPRRGSRLNVVETLRAAAPWQAIRRGDGPVGRLSIRRDDMRVMRFKRRQETTTIFVVDASGSSAFQRLGEAKGAVELMLAECYVRRDRVALLAFRGAGAELLLPPTRSLTRAKRSLAALPGGGGTPLAAAIDAASALAEQVGRDGGSAVLVFMTDGRANIASDGKAGRERAATDARAAARRLRAGGATALMVDISLRPNETASAIAREMGARYLALPAADSRLLSGIVGQEAAAAAGRR